MSELQVVINQYVSAKQAMIDGYRGMHKAPEYLNWSEVQDLQDDMQSAAVALAEYIVTHSAPAEFQIPPHDQAPITDEQMRCFSSQEARAVDEILSEETPEMAHETELSDLFWIVNNALAPDTPDEERRAAEVRLKQEGLLEDIPGWAAASLDDEFVFPSFDITEDDLPSQIDRFEAEHPESIPGDGWLTSQPDTEEEAAERAALAEEKRQIDDAFFNNLLKDETRAYAPDSDKPSDDDWIKPATEEELEIANRGGNSGVDYDDDDDYYDDDEEGYY